MRRPHFLWTPGPHKYDAAALKGDWETFVHEVMSGSRRGVSATLLRGGLSLAEPFYAGAVTLRNRFYDHRASHSAALPRPVISIGNITTGGTGKTPMVRWLADRLRQEAHHVAILSRGYGSAAGSLGDEQVMLERLLNTDHETPVVLAANPNRILAARQVLAAHPEVDVFVLDDGFQHRVVARDLDIVLISAMSPFGYGHVLPRGMLREPLRGLRRAGAVVVSHADRVDRAQLSQIEDQLRKSGSTAAIHHAKHAAAGFRKAATPPSAAPDVSPTGIQSSKVFAFCAIGNPAAFFEKLKQLGAQLVATEPFRDHHFYTSRDLTLLRDRAKAAGADVLVTTEKDWAKIVALEGAADTTLPILRMDVQIEFFDSDEQRLLEQVRSAINR